MAPTACTDGDSDCDYFGLSSGKRNLQEEMRGKLEEADKTQTQTSLRKKLKLRMENDAEE